MASQVRNLLRATYALALSFFISLSVFGSEFRVGVSSSAALTVSFRLTPEVEAWEEIAQNSYSGNGYKLTLEEHIVGSRSELKVQLTRDDDKPFTLENFEANWSVRDPELFAIWSYNQPPSAHKNYQALSSEAFGVVTSANSGIPYAAAVTREGKNLLAVGALSQNRTLYLGGRPQEDQEYWIILGTQLPLHTRKFTETLFTDVSPESWFEVARGYAAWVDEKLHYQQFPISPACYYPMYDSWYWTLDNVNLDLYWKTLVQAKELGFQSYLFDSGWESETGELGKWLEGSIGNFFAPENKLPKFDDFLFKVKHSLQMNVVLWVAPYLMGRQSVNYPAMKEAHSRFNYSKPKFRGGDENAPYTLPLDSKFAENVSLCPRASATQDYFRTLFDRVSASYHPDGYWLDFQDFVPFLCQSTHKHSSTFGKGFNACQQEIGQTTLERIEQPTIELRYPVANLNNKRYANLWQSTDSPEDFDAMRLCNLMMRPFSQGVVMGTDEMYWSPDADETTTAKFMITTVFSGVPAIGINFQQAPKSHSEIVKEWLSFYRENQSDLTGGTFKPVGDFVFPDQKIESKDKAFIYLRSGDPSMVDIDGTPQTIYIANCSEADNISITLRGSLEGRYLLQILDRKLRRISRKSLLLDRESTISERVPQAGVIQLIRQK